MNAVATKEEVTLADMLLDRRVELGVRQADAAQACGVTRTAFTNWERGATYPAKLYRKRVAEWLGVSVRDLPKPVPIAEREKRK